MPLQVLTVVVLPVMSSKKEEIEEKCAAAAASIFPGWTVNSLVICIWIMGSSRLTNEIQKVLCKWVSSEHARA